jgi:hypothetical protein
MFFHRFGFNFESNKKLVLSLVLVPNSTKRCELKSESQEPSLEPLIFTLLIGEYPHNIGNTKFINE